MPQRPCFTCPPQYMPSRVSVVNPFCLTGVPCHADTRPRPRDSSDSVHSLRAYCRYFLHETYARSARLTARFGDVVWAADEGDNEGDITGGPRNRESFSMDGYPSQLARLLHNRTRSVFSPCAQTAWSDVATPRGWCRWCVQQRREAQLPVGLRSVVKREPGRSPPL